jgi:CubicO group peptidase (beta-lactamase class C family)
MNTSQIMPERSFSRRAFLLSYLSLAVARGVAGPPADLDAWVARAMKEFEVPGLALAIVKDGRVDYAKGYGVRRLGEPQAVDPHTLFGIASNTKAFTAAALAILVDEKRIAWDDPVLKHLPGFQAWDPWVTRELTVRDLLCHRSGLGLGAGDLLFWPDTDVTRAEVIAATRHIRPASSFRSRYAYNNLTFVLAGEIVRAVTGESWEHFVRSRILTPLGMAETQIAPVAAQSGLNIASPHSRGWRLEGMLTPIPYTRDETWSAAAGIRSNVTDLAKWILAQLGRGRLADDRRLWSESAAEEMWSVQTPLRISEPPAPLKSTRPKFAGYGLGWSLRDYQGRKTVSHGGALTGMVSTTILIPEERLGLVILTNQEESGAFSAVAYHILDHYLGLPPADWIAAYRTARTEMLTKANEAERKLTAERAAGTRPSLPLEKLAGEYVDAWYGKLIMSVVNGRLAMRMSRTPALAAELDHWQYDTFRARFRDKTVPDAFVTFALDHRGAVDQIRMVAVSSLADFSFDYHDLLFRPVEPRK